MNDFKIQNDADKIISISRTIRFSSEQFERITQLSEKTGASFNKIVGQCVTYALEHLSEDE